MSPILLQFLGVKKIRQPNCVLFTRIFPKPQCFWYVTSSILISPVLRELKSGIEYKKIIINKTWCFMYLTKVLKALNFAKWNYRFFIFQKIISVIKPINFSFSHFPHCSPIFRTVKSEFFLCFFPLIGLFRQLEPFVTNYTPEFYKISFMTYKVERIKI